MHVPMSSESKQEVTPSSSTTTHTTSSTTSKTLLKPDEYTKGLNEEHIVRLAEDAYKNFAGYTKAELELTIEDCKLLERMNVSTKDKYSQMNQMSQRLMKEMSKLQNTHADFSSFIQQVETIHEQTIQMENTAIALDEYSKHLEKKLSKVAASNTMTH